MSDASKIEDGGFVVGLFAVSRGNYGWVLCEITEVKNVTIKATEVGSWNRKRTINKKDCVFAGPASAARTLHEKLVSSYALCDDARSRAEIERLRKEIERRNFIQVRSGPTAQDKAAVWQKQAEEMATRADAAESELSTLRDILVLCGELGGMQTGETMADYLRRLIDEVAGKEAERELAKAAAITAYLAQREKVGWVMVPKAVGSDKLSTTTITAEFIDARSSAERG